MDPPGHPTDTVPQTQRERVDERETGGDIRALATQPVQSGVGETRHASEVIEAGQGPEFPTQVLHGHQQDRRDGWRQRAVAYLADTVKAMLAKADPATLTPAQVLANRTAG